MKKRIRSLIDCLIRYNEESTEKLLFIIGIFVFILTMITFLLGIVTNHLVGKGMSSCLFLGLTGLYCPGCGGTRAFFFLFQGKFIKSFIFNPFTMYVTIFYILFMGSHALSNITKGKIKGLKFRPWYLYTSIAILILQWIVKNILVIFYSTYII